MSRTIQDLASEAHDRVSWSLPTMPHYCREMLYAAQLGMSLDEWTILFMDNALKLIKNSSDEELLDDLTFEPFKEISQLTTWLASNEKRVEFCDEVLKNDLLDIHSSKLTMKDILEYGMWIEMNTVLGICLEHLTKLSQVLE